MKSFEIGLAARVTISAMILIVLSSAILLFVENRRLYESHVKEVSSDLGQDIETSALRINQAVKTMSQDLLFLSDLPPISGMQRASQNHGYDARDHNSQQIWLTRLEQIYASFLKAHPNYTRVRFISLTGAGKEVLRIDNHNGAIETSSSDKLQSVADRDYVKATLRLKENQVYLSDIDLNQELGLVNGAYRPTLRAATPIFTQSGKLFGMVVLNMNIDSLLMPAISNLPNMRTIIANGEEQFLLRTDLNRDIKVELNLKDKISDKFPFIKSMFNLQVSNYLPLQHSSAGSEDLYFAAKRIHFDPNDPAHYLLLMCAISNSDMTKQVATTPTPVLFTEFVVMLLISGIVMIYLQRVFSPLKKIAEAADKITAGDHDNTRLPENSMGEIRSLARAINNLVSSLMMNSHQLKRMNEELNESQERTNRASLLYKMLSEISSANIHIKSRDQLFKSTCQIIQASGLFRMVWIGLLDKKSGAVKPVAQAGYVEGYLDNLEINIYDSEKSMGPSGVAFRTGLPVTCDDLANDPRMQLWRDEALKRGYLASATFPITESGETIGVLTLYFNQKGLLDDELFNVLKGMMEDMSFALDFIVESQLREDVQKELHDLTLYLQTALENERTHIARELHDELGQSMTALRFDLKWLHETISTKDASVQVKLQAMNDMLSRTVDAIRRISEDLRPGMLDNLGLAAAIENHVVKFKEQSGIDCDLSMNQADFDLDDEVATALFRIVQESLTNVARHSGATHVDIRLHELEDEILLIVQDNGRGLPSSHDVSKKTFGLLGMRERIKMLGGTLDIFNEKGAGVRIEACVSKHKKG